MTTFQEPQPQSRRSVRQGERETSDPKPPFSTTSPLAAPPPSFSAPTSGRRSAQPAPTAAPEPLLYSAPVSPGDEVPPAPSFRPRGTAAAPPAPDQDSWQTSAQAMPPEQTYRTRDFSPEGRRAAAPSPSFAREPEWTHTSPPPTDLGYQTQAAPSYEAPAQAYAAPTYVPPADAPPAYVPPVATDAPVHSAPAQHTLPVEQTLSRRELRALQLAEQAAAAPLAAPAQVTQPAPVTPLSPPIAQVPHFSAPPEPLLNTGLTSAISEFDTLTREPAHDPAPRATPAGHWSSQTQLDEHDLFETTLTRTVGGGVATTSALVLPMPPAGADIRGPLTSTGEIMLTGSIDLPRSLSSTGASARFDHDGIDALFDAGDAEVISTDSAPVSAIKAVSTHNSGFAVTHTQKPKGTRGLTVLLIAASTMAVVVAGLLIAAFALNVF